MPSSIFSCQQGNAPINKISSICACVYLYTVYKLLICKSVPLWVNKRTFTNPCPQSEHYNKLCYGSYVWPVHIKVTVTHLNMQTTNWLQKTQKQNPKKRCLQRCLTKARENISSYLCLCNEYMPCEKAGVCDSTHQAMCVCVCTCAHVCVWEWKRVRESEGGLYVFTAISRISSYEGHWAAQQGGKHLRKQMESDSYQAAI